MRKEKKAAHLQPLVFVKNCLIFLAIFSTAVTICYFYMKATGLEAYASPIFVLAVLLVSRFTEGYVFGLVSSVVGVVCVNYFFTYPYMAVNFSITGYPLTFLTLLIVSMITSTLTTRAKQRDQLVMENEREKIRADLLRSVSHDIRTPLTSIIGSTDVLLEDPDMTRPEAAQLLTDVQEEAKWLLRMTENLLLITKMDQDQTISLEPWAVEEVVGETVLKLQKTYPQMPVEVSVPSTPLFVPMDPILIGQVLFNLAENSILHGETVRTVSINVTAGETEAVFCVSDDGKGFPEELLSAYAEGHIRAEISADRAAKRNMGLGLRVSSAIVTAHNGRLELNNTPEGATASIILPLETAAGRKGDMIL